MAGSITIKLIANIGSYDTSVINMLSPNSKGSNVTIPGMTALKSDLAVPGCESSADFTAQKYIQVVATGMTTQYLWYGTVDKIQSVYVGTSWSSKQKVLGCDSASSGDRTMTIKVGGEIELTLIS